MFEKGFADQNNMNLHKKSHTGENPQKSKLCEKEFAEKRKLTIHEKCHINLLFVKRHFLKSVH